MQQEHKHGQSGRSRRQSGKLSRWRREELKKKRDGIYRSVLRESVAFRNIVQNPAAALWYRWRIFRDYQKLLRQPGLTEAQLEEVMVQGIALWAEKKAARKKERASLLFQDRHRVLLSAALALLLVLSSVYLCVSLFDVPENTGVISGYLAEEEDMLAIETAYAALEEKLQQRVDRFEEENPGAEAYEYKVSEIGHSPYTLISLISAYYNGNWTLEEAEGLIPILFERQYHFSSNTRDTTERITVQAGESLGSVSVTGYCSCAVCCGQWAGDHTASGIEPKAGRTVAVDAHNPIVPMGTQVIINGQLYTVEDTGNLNRYNTDFDIYFDTHEEALNWGRQRLEVTLANGDGEDVQVTLVHRRCTVTLTNTSLEEIAEDLLTQEQLARFKLYQRHQGNRPDLFPEE